MLEGGGTASHVTCFTLMLPSGVLQGMFDAVPWWFTS